MYQLNSISSTSIPKSLPSTLVSFDKGVEGFNILNVIILLPLIRKFLIFLRLIFLLFNSKEISL